MSKLTPSTTILVNGRSYRIPKSNEVFFALLLDGSSMEYIDRACQSGCMPFVMELLGRSLDSENVNQNEQKLPQQQRTIKFQRYFSTDLSKQSGELALCTSAMPSFTNPNNVSVITGVSPRVHGISGNYYYDRDNNNEIAMNTPALLMCDTILARMAKQGVHITILTVKDKLKALLAANIDETDKKHAVLSVETAVADDVVDQVEQTRRVSLPQLHHPPSVYTPSCSVVALDAAKDLCLAALDQDEPHIFYVSTTDYVQHRYEPGHPIANELYAGIDRVLRELHETKRVRIAVTADHGMNAKHKEDGQPRVVLIEDQLKLAGYSKNEYHLILPITDSHIQHHGNLGSYACLYVTNSEKQHDILQFIRSLPGIYTVVSSADASVAFDLPRSRIGDAVLISNRDAVIGRSQTDLEHSPVPDNLRSHGGLDETVVPMLLNFRLDPQRLRLSSRGRLRNYDLFDLLLNASV